MKRVRSMDDTADNDDTDDCLPPLSEAEQDAIDNMEWGDADISSVGIAESQLTTTSQPPPPDDDIANHQYYYSSNNASIVANYQQQQQQQQQYYYNESDAPIENTTFGSSGGLYYPPYKQQYYNYNNGSSSSSMDAPSPQEQREQQQQQRGQRQQETILDWPLQPVGMPNFGSSCYMNATLQCILASMTIHNNNNNNSGNTNAIRICDISHLARYTAKPIQRALLQWLTLTMMRPPPNTHMVRAILTPIYTHCITTLHMDRCQQQDVMDYIVPFMDDLFDDAEKPATIQSTLQSRVVCAHCQHQHLRYDDANQLNLPLATPAAVATAPNTTAAAAATAPNTTAAAAATSPKTTAAADAMLLIYADFDDLVQQNNVMYWPMSYEQPMVHVNSPMLESDPQSPQYQQLMRLNINQLLMLIERNSIRSIHMNKFSVPPPLTVPRTTLVWWDSKQHRIARIWQPEEMQTLTTANPPFIQCEWWQTTQFIRIIAEVFQMTAESTLQQQQQQAQKQQRCYIALYPPEQLSTLPAILEVAAAAADKDDNNCAAFDTAKVFAARHWCRQMWDHLNHTDTEFIGLQRDADTPDIHARIRHVGGCQSAAAAHVFRKCITTTPAAIAPSPFDNHNQQQKRLQLQQQRLQAEQQRLQEEQQRQQPIMLSDCIQAFFAKEVMTQDNQFRCDACRQKSCAEKHMSIKRLTGNTLVMSVKRFRYDAQGGATKLFHPIRIPLEIDMSCYMAAAPTNDTPPTQAAECKFQLRAIVEHLGTSPNSGHYVARVLGGDGKTWFVCDDTTVTIDQIHTAAAADKNAAIQSNHAYIVFYQRRNVCAVHDSTDNSGGADSGCADNSDGRDSADNSSSADNSGGADSADNSGGRDSGGDTSQ